MLPRGERGSRRIFDLFPILKTMMGRRGGDLSGGQQQQLSIARALVMKPRLIVLDEPTEGIQPSIIKDIGRVIALLRRRGDMAILLVEQYFDFAQELAQTMVVMDRGDIVLAGRREDLDEADVRRRLRLNAVSLQRAVGELRLVVNGSGPRRCSMNCARSDA